MTKCFFFALLFIPIRIFCAPAISLDDAIVRTLENQKEIQISIYNIEKQKGVLQQSAGPFDPLLTSTLLDVFANNIEEDPEIHYRSKDTVTQTALTKQTRAGTSLALYGTYEFYNPQHKDTLTNTRASQVVFQINQPFLRNFLYGINRQMEKANALELQAVNWDTLQTISDKVLNTITSYWEVVAAQQNVLVMENAIGHIKKLTDLTRELIQGEQLAAEDINQPLALLYNEQITYSQVTGTLYSAKQQLTFAMGEFNEEANGGFEQNYQVAQGLPEIPLNEFAMEKRKDSWIAMAFDQRFDVLAAETRIEELRELVKGAENQTLPQLDVVGQFTVNDFHPEFQSSFAYPTTGIGYPGEILVAQTAGTKKNFSTNYAVGVSLSVPFNNDSAVGYLRQQLSRQTQSIFQLQFIKQNLINLILQTVNNQIILKRQLQEARQTVEKYERLVNDETEKLQAGFSTVFVLLNFETTLISARLNLVNISKQYIQGIASLRALTGTLILINEDQYQINIANVLNYPGEDICY